MISLVRIHPIFASSGPRSSKVSSVSISSSYGFISAFTVSLTSPSDKLSLMFCLGMTVVSMFDELLLVPGFLVSFSWFTLRLVMSSILGELLDCDAFISMLNFLGGGFDLSMLGGVRVLGFWLDVGVVVFVVPNLVLPPGMLCLLFELVVLWVLFPLALVLAPVLVLCCFGQLGKLVAPALSALVLVSLLVLLFESLLSFSFGLSFLLVKLWLT